MSELFAEIYRNSTLNRNVSTLVVEYLTDPPPLPFLAELIDIMNDICWYTTFNLYYEFTTIDMSWGYDDKDNFGSIIKKFDFGWSIQSK